MSSDCKHPLKAWASERKMMMKDLARKVGVSTTAIHYWVNRVSCPSPQMMKRIEELTGGAVTASHCINYFMEKQDGK